MKADIQHFIKPSVKTIVIRKNKEEEEILWMEKLSFFISHRLRSPLTTILGLTNLLNEKDISQDQLKIIAIYMKQSILLLDSETRIMSLSANEKIVKLKNKQYQKCNLV